MNEALTTKDQSNATRQALSKEQIEIMYHTVKRAANCHYCGGGKDMEILIFRGFMRSLGFKPFVPDEYFTITPEGMEALRLSQQK
jgi:hypothetical protein